MAWQVSKRVWDNVPVSITKNDRLMLLALAEFADEYGVCWPGYDALASMVGVDPRTAMRLVQHLEKERQIINFQQSGQKGGRGHTNLYLIITGLSKAEIEEIIKTHPIISQKGDKIYTLYEQKKGDIFSEKGDKNQQKGDIFSEKGDIAMSPEPSIEPLIEPSINHQSAPPAKSKVVPAFKVFVEVTGKANLNKTQIAEIDKVVGRDPPILEKWREAVRAWQLRGYKSNDINGQLDFFRNGIPVYKNGAKHGYEQTRQSKTTEQSPPGVEPDTWANIISELGTG